MSFSSTMWQWNKHKLLIELNWITLPQSLTQFHSMHSSHRNILNITVSIHTMTHWNIELTTWKQNTMYSTKPLHCQHNRGTLIIMHSPLPQKLCYDSDDNHIETHTKQLLQLSQRDTHWTVTCTCKSESYVQTQLWQTFRQSVNAHVDRVMTHM